MVKHIHLLFDNDDFKELKRDKDEYGLSWEAYVSLLIAPQVNKEIMQIMNRRNDRVEAGLQRTEEIKNE